MHSTRNLTKSEAPLVVLFMFGLLLCLTGCKKEKRPEGVLSEPEVSSLLVEMYIAEAKLTGVHISRASPIHIFQPYEESYLLKRKISKEVLKKTYRYYLDHPEEFEKIY